MTNLFEIGVGFRDETQTYVAIMRCVPDNKVATVEDQTLRVVTARIGKLMRQKTKQLKAFPLPEKGRIISLTETRPKNLVAPNGRILNGS